MVDYQISVFDHNAEVGYHFRQPSGDPMWDTMVKLENDSVRSLSQEEIEERVRFVPLRPSEMVILASKKIRSDGRTAIRTCSLKISNSEGTLRWQVGLHRVLEQYLNDNSPGGSIGLEASKAQLTPNVAGLLPATQFLKNSEFHGLSVDEIMTLWSYLPPQNRGETEVVVGSLSENESSSKAATRVRWGLNMNEPYVQPKNTSKQYQTWSSNFNQDAIKVAGRAASIADSTGFDATEWSEVFESEMDRRGQCLTGADHLSIRIKLSQKDLNLERRTSWRKLSIETLIQTIDINADFFHKHAVPIRPDEIDEWSGNDQLKILGARVLSTKQPDDVEQLLNDLQGFHGRLSSDVWNEILGMAPLATWLQAPFNVVLRTFEPMMGDSRSAMILIEKINQASRQGHTQNQVILFRLLRGHRLPNSFFDLISEWRAILPNQSKQFESQSNGDTFFDRPRSVFLLDWENPMVLARDLAEKHVTFGRMNPGQTCLAMADFSTTQTAIHVQYLNQLEQSTRVKFSHSTSSVNLEIAVAGLSVKTQPLIDAGMFPPISTVWFERLLHPSTPVGVIKSTLIKLEMQMNQIPDDILSRIYAKRTLKKWRQLKGYPSPFFKLGNQSPELIYARLYIQPTKLERVSKVIFTPMFWLWVFAWLILYLPRIAMYAYSRTSEKDWQYPVIQEAHFGSTALYWGACVASLFALFMINRRFRNRFRYILGRRG